MLLLGLLGERGLPLVSLVALDSGTPSYLATHMPFPGIQCPSPDTHACTQMHMVCTCLWVPPLLRCNFFQHSLTYWVIMSPAHLSSENNSVQTLSFLNTLIASHQNASCICFVTSKGSSNPKNKMIKSPTHHSALGGSADLRQRDMLIESQT